MERPVPDPSRLDLEGLIGDIAKRHNVLLRPDDPLLVAVTLNELLLARALARVEETVAAAQDQIAAGTAKHMADAKVLSERLITAAAEHMRAEVRAAATQAVEQIGRAVEVRLQGVNRTFGDIQRARTAVLWGAAITIAFAAIAGTLVAVFPLLG